MDTDAICEDRPCSVAYEAATLGTLYWRAGQLDLAEPLLRQTADADAQARADLGHLLLATGRRNEAVQEWGKGVVDSQPESMVPLANLLSREGDQAHAADPYERAYELGDPHAALNLALDLYSDERLPDALSWARRASERGDEQAKAWLPALEEEMGGGKPR
ncbi:hypothetical protein LLS1_01700 [Leifsonia sp. LS1]|uniref:hypothetical protein n=1 Tax=Leifsonia sp. LS1 TaxID=2828483 RepID=UPI001CFCD984|nr:hypothetical protein [Leifsonia sp. LS1]GIT78501.1 hypothetical protein LLS1_01700 [Leifsonia sp. LS1]